MVSADAPEQTKELWWLHGHPHSARYSNPKLNTLGALVKHAADVFHDVVAFMYPASSKSDTEYLPVTWNQFHQVTDRLAVKYGHLFQNEITAALSNSKQPTVALLGGGTTLDYFCTQIALQKLNFRVLLLADRSPGDVIQTMLVKCQALAIIHDLRNAKVASNFIRKVPMIELSLQLDVVVPQNEVDVLQFEDNCDPWERHSFVLHSSGSTGPPKAIVHTNRSMLLIARMYRLFPDFHVENWFLLFPLYHIAGISIMLSGLPNGLITSLPPLSWPPSASYILQACKTLALSNHPVDCIHCAPTIIENLYDFITKNSNDFSTLTSLKVLQPGGAKLSDALVLRLVSQGVNMKTTYGSTEIGPPLRSIPHSQKNPHCYNLRSLYPDSDKFEMRDIGGGIYECIVLKGFELAAELWTEEDDEPYHTNDMFKQEPPGSGNFVLQGRRDDFLVHSDGNNTSAGALQLDIQDANPIVKKVLAVGHSRPCVGLLVELKPNTGMDYEEAMDNLWLGIQKVNGSYPRYSQVLRSMIYILPPYVILPVTPKGNVKRNEVLASFEDIINRMYDKLLGVDGELEDRILYDRGSLLKLLQDQVSAAFNVPVISFKDTTSFYEIGMDSLSALQLRSSLSKIMGNVSLSTIFENPSIGQLKDYFLGGESRTEEAKHISFINRTIARYTADFSSWPKLPATADTRAGMNAVLLTGASGSLGSALLETLSTSSEVSKIFALVRGPNGYTSLHKSLEHRGMDASTVLNSGKLELLNYSMKDPLLGLDIDSYHRLSKEVTTVTHCAWKVNFNQTVEDFEDDCIRGTMALIRFCHTGRPKVFAFTSSVSACMGKGFKGDEVPEQSLGDDPTVAMETGYAQSKFIAERLMEAASKQLSMSCVVLRVGQLCGHSNYGHWSKQDMYPIMFATSFRLKTVPTFKKRLVDWLPVDIAAGTIKDILTEKNPHMCQRCTVFNIVNPSPLPWSILLEILQECQLDRKEDRMVEVPIQAWTKHLSRAEAENEEGDRCLPAVRLLDFFEAMALEDSQVPCFGTTNTWKVSETLRGCLPVNKEWIEVLTSVLRRQYQLIEPATKHYPHVWIAQRLSDQKKGIVKDPVHSDLRFRMNSRYQLATEIRLLQGPFKGARGIRQLVNLITLSEEPERIDAAVLEYGAIDLWQYHCVERRRLSLSQIKDIAVQILQALTTIHSHRLVHIDLKPQNIIFTHLPENANSKLEVNLIDLGSAWSLDDEWRHQITHPYLRSPESWMMLPWGTASDIWSFGAIIGGLLMGPPCVMLKKSAQPGFEAVDPELEEKECYLRSLYTLFPFPDSFVHRLPKDWQDRIATYPKSLSRMPSTENKEGILVTSKVPRNIFHVREKDWRIVEDTLKIDPGDRPITYELLENPWLKPTPWYYPSKYYLPRAWTRSRRAWMKARIIAITAFSFLVPAINRFSSMVHFLYNLRNVRIEFREHDKYRHRDENEDCEESESDSDKKRHK
ncbi:hypothetical protein MMC17_008951 [Xylographa soralifera]|nr:hypothetical protein [Xylographa soralifera]